MNATTPSKPSLDSLSHDALTSRIFELLRRERGTIVDFLWHLAEVERRKLHLELAHESLFDYCSNGLGLTRSATYRRITASRLMTQFPAIAEYLSDGRLCLTTLALLRDLLDEANHRQLLDRASGRTE